MSNKEKAKEQDLSNHIMEENLTKFTDEEYKSYEKKMDLVLLHNVSEQRCKSYGCKLIHCISKSRDMNKCQTIFRELNNCVDKEKKKLIYEYIKTNKQLNY